MKRLASGIVAVLFSMAIAAGAVPQAHSSVAADYFPLTEGSVWLYRVNGSHELMMRVRGTRRVGPITCSLLESVVNGMVTQRECYIRQGDTVFAYMRGYASGDLPLVPPQPSLKFPPKVGTAWAWEGRAGQLPMTLTLTMQWARAETLTLPGGTFQTVQLYIEGYAGSDRIQSWRWFAPGVGMVREDSIAGTLRIVAELADFQPGK